MIDAPHLLCAANKKTGCEAGPGEWPGQETPPRQLLERANQNISGHISAAPRQIMSQAT
jgi:hypothetical protein